MKNCCVPGCDKPGAFSTRTKPTWCTEHLQVLYNEAGLKLLEDFTKPSSFLLTECLECGFQAHYRFEYVQSKLKIDEKVCRACYWREWAKGSRATSLQKGKPEDLNVVRKVAEEHGHEFLGSLTNPSLVGDPYAVKCRHCGRISAERLGDIGWGCTCTRNSKTATAGTSKAKGANLLKNSAKDAVSWWDHERNDQAFWESVKSKSRKKAWWVCPEGHSFEETIAEMTRHASCPRCNEKRLREWDEKLRDLEGKTIADVPELLVAWNEPFPPNLVLVTESTGDSGYQFVCPKGHRNTRQPLSYLEGGCSACKAEETKKKSLAKAAENPMSTRLSPEIASQWHPKRNGNLKLATISPESRRKVWWLDPVCGHEFQATPRERDKYQRWRCPICHTILDSLAYHYPDVAEEWSPQNSLTAWQVRPHSTQLDQPPLWVCRNDPSHVWRANPSARINGAQCPECKEYGKSQIELLYTEAAREYWGEAKSGPRVHSPHFLNHSSWSVDTLVPLPSGRFLSIEYDGSYWHKDKARVDTEKSLDLLRAGHILVRIREVPLLLLNIDHRDYHELTVYVNAQDPGNEIRKIAEMIGEKR